VDRGIRREAKVYWQLVDLFPRIYFVVTKAIQVQESLQSCINLQQPLLAYSTLPQVIAMKYADHLRQLTALGQSEDGPALSLHLSHASKQSAKVLSSLPAHALANPSTLQSQAQQLYIPEPWATIGYQHVCSLVAGKKGDHQLAYTSQAQLVSTFLGKVVGAASSWCLPVLYVLLADLRYLAAVVSRPVFPSLRD
jgi:hypothetical protein